MMRHGESEEIAGAIVIDGGRVPGELAHLKKK
jgi:hypothetical protein